MDRTERTEFINAKKVELTVNLQEHIAELEKLDTTTTFDFDIATDIQPELIDNTSEMGKEQLKFWKTLYEGLEKEPRYMVTKRYAVGLEPGCYGFGKDARYIVSEAWVRIYKNPTLDSVAFVRNIEGKGEVYIDSPSVLLNKYRSEPTHTPSTLLFSEDTPTFSVLRAETEIMQFPRVYFYDSLVDLIEGSDQFTYTDRKQMRLPVSLSAYTATERLIDPESVAAASNTDANQAN